MPRAAKLCRHEGHWYTKAGSPSGTYFGRCDELSYDQAKTLFRQYLGSLKSQRERRRLPRHSVIRICASHLRWVRRTLSRKLECHVGMGSSGHINFL